MGQAEIVQTAGRFHDVIEIMMELIAERLNQNLTLFNPTNVMFYFDANTGNTLVIHLLDSNERAVASCFFGC